ncbi:AzlC family ABC transporter permease [Falsigemmobacter intermedius]|uniref:AzlC family ABC transporter permease n=1 Tax=Falsigemmobacter intermedius TaxID=1553448 RepID=UPI003F0398FE
MQAEQSTSGSIGDRSSVRRAFLRGVLVSSPFLLVIIPFAMLFGVLATEAGLDLLTVMAFTVAVFAGSSQLTALQLMQDNAPAAVILATSLAVNLRMSMYSAALTPWLGRLGLWSRAWVAFLLVDQSYAASVAEYERNPKLTGPERLAYFFGTVVLIAPFWYLATGAGAILGAQIPPELALDFAMPLSFIALTAPMLRTIPHLVAAFTSVTLALTLTWLPWSSGILVAAITAMLAGAFTEMALEKRA